jgi:hypothetical protein
MIRLPFPCPSFNTRKTSVYQFRFERYFGGSEEMGLLGFEDSAQSGMEDTMKIFSFCLCMRISPFLRPCMCIILVLGDQSAKGTTGYNGTSRDVVRGSKPTGYVTVYPPCFPVSGFLPPFSVLSLVLVSSSHGAEMDSRPVVSSESSVRPLSC